MTPEIQTWLALAIVLATAGVFLGRLIRRRKKFPGSGCAGHGCGCGPTARRDSAGDRPVTSE